MTGTVIHVVTNRGFGFIKPHDGSDELFFHVSGVASSLKFDEELEGTEVAFEVFPRYERLQAVGVRPIR